MPRTPQQGEKTPGWMSMGYAVFERLDKMGYAPYPTGDEECQSLEVYPHAAYAVLLGRVPFPKRSFSGRIQRQLVLYGCEVDVPDPMRVFEEFTRYRLLQGVLPLEGLHSDRELDALIAAYIAWLSATNPLNVQLIGRREEGQVVLPDSQMRARY